MWLFRNATGATDMRIIIALMLLVPFAACVAAPVGQQYSYASKYRGCVNHDLRDFHGSNAQQC